jgi:hypothetical protein
MAKIHMIIEDVSTEKANLTVQVTRFIKPGEPGADTLACKLADLLEALVQQAQLSNYGKGVTHMPSTVQH